MHSRYLSSSILIFISIWVYQACALDYSDLEALGNTCPKKDSCFVRKSNTTFAERNCECDADCIGYNDCCIDARRSNSRKNGRVAVRSYPKMCLPFGNLSYEGVYVINTCSVTWNGSSDVRKKCERAVNLADPLNALPVIAIHQGVTYKNQYCAECNTVPSSGLVFFQLGTNCATLTKGANSVTLDYILNNLEYETASRKWGAYSWNSRSMRREFHDCDLYFKLPTYVTNGFRLCWADTVSTCPRGWPRLFVKRACEEYKAVVSGKDGRLFRNPHCAICNGLTVDEYSCESGMIISRKPPMSFALLLDVNRGDGDLVGQSTPSCPPNHMYDPFMKKCQRLKCLPQLRNCG